MTMPKRYPLKVSHPYEADHDASFMKLDLRTKSEVDAYFTGYAGGTVVWYGTEGTDYEFDAELGFRTKTNSGGLFIFFGRMLSTLEDTHFYDNGFTFDFQVLTSQWTEPEYSPALYDQPVTDLPGAVAGSLDNTNLVTFYYNNAVWTESSVKCYDSQTSELKGRNRLSWVPCNSASGAALIGRPIALKNKGKFLNCRVTAQNSHGNMWIDQMSAIPPHGGNSSGNSGERWTIPFSAFNAVVPAKGPSAMYIGTNNGATQACTRWIRNIRLFKTPTYQAPHPKLARVGSFGDSYSATSLGPGVSSATNDNIGGLHYPGAYSSTVGGYYGDVHSILRFQQVITQGGFQIGGMYASGFGGRDFQDTLNSGGFIAQALRYRYTMLFTFGMHNDVSPIANSVLTIAQLQTIMLTVYLYPMMENGCHGWGFVMPSISKTNYDSGYSSAHNSILAMMMGLPAVFDAAYPQHAGKVKVYDATSDIGVDWRNNINWQHYWTLAEVTHPSLYGQQIFGEKAAKMALEWLHGA